MKIPFYNRWTGALICKIEIPDDTEKELRVKVALELAVKTGADIARADLFGADLTRAILAEADLTGAILAEADLTDAKLTGANLTGSQSATEEDAHAGPK